MWSPYGMEAIFYQISGRKFYVKFFHLFLCPWIDKYLSLFRVEKIWLAWILLHCIIRIQIRRCFLRYVILRVTIIHNHVIAFFWSNLFLHRIVPWTFMHCVHYMLLQVMLLFLSFLFALYFLFIYHFKGIRSSLMLTYYYNLGIALLRWLPFGRRSKWKTGIFVWTILNRTGICWLIPYLLLGTIVLFNLYCACDKLLWCESVKYNHCDITLFRISVSTWMSNIFLCIQDISAAAVSWNIDWIWIKCSKS